MAALEPSLRLQRRDTVDRRAMSETPTSTDRSPPGRDEVVAVACGMATAVAPDSGITAAQAAILRAVTKAVTGFDLDYHALAPLEPEELADLLEDRDLNYRHRIVHHMVLAEIVLKPLPRVVAERVTRYATALGVSDDFVRLAHRYAEGTLDLAAFDLRRSGFDDRWDEERSTPLHTNRPLANPFDGIVDPELQARWERFAKLDEGSVGSAVWTMYQARGFQLPGTVGSASAYLAQHDFVHVLADYGTRMECELEVFALVGRADPDPKGFAWLATMVGLFETGYVDSHGPFNANVEERHLQLDGMDVRLADAIRRGKVIAEHFGRDLLDVDYHELAEWPVDDVRVLLGIPPKSLEAVAAGSPGVFDPGGISDLQRNAGHHRHS
jgi:hypothetical protein